MSDGPHRSLPMRPGWKKVAEYADNEAFVSNDVRDAVVAAVVQDWRKDISSRLVSSIQDALGDSGLFRDSVQALEDLRPSVAGSVMGNALLDHTIYAVSDGKAGGAALEEAVTSTLTDWSGRSARQVEEHYLRKTSIENTKNVRSRIEEAIQKAPFKNLASRLLDPGARPAPRLVKHDRLDDGVPL